jgi:hypothetical protein
MMGALLHFRQYKNLDLQIAGTLDFWIYSFTVGAD